MVKEIRDWTDFYGNVKEAFLTTPQSPHGKGVDLRMFVYSDHAGSKTNRRFCARFMICMNMFLISWLSRTQATVEGFVFGSEFIALKQEVETLRGIRYILRMMGVPIGGPSYINGDNISAVNNTSKPKSTLKKKSGSICYDFARETVIMK